MFGNTPRPALLALLSLLSPLAQAEEAPQAEITLAPVVVSGERIEDNNLGGIWLNRQSLPKGRANTSDTARLLEDIPGVSTYGAGGISSLPVVHGLADDRLRTQVDGMDLMSACPNHMNPALSFIDPSKVASVQVFAGVTPVSVGGDSIGGSVLVKSAPPKFAKADEGLLFSGQAGGFYRSNGYAWGDHVSLTAAGEFINLSYSESTSNSHNYWAADNFKKPGLWSSYGARQLDGKEVGSSEYGGSRNRDYGLALRLTQDHLVELTVGEQRLNYEGFPNQRMDMIASIPDPNPDNAGGYVLAREKASNVNRVTNLRYTGQYAWGELEAKAFRQELKHHMDMIQERFDGMYMPMDTKATTTGGLLKASIELSPRDTLRLGADYQKYRLDDWWPPIGISAGSMCCNDFWNIRDGKRDRRGVFAEWEAQWSPAWVSQLGVRHDHVATDTGTVQGYSNLYRTEATRYNRQDHREADDHLDLTALVRYTPDATQSYEAGAARKTRSPNLYERYPWSTNMMAALMNNFVGDGNAYVGNPDLKPEIAHVVSFGGEWHDADKARWNLKLTAHRTYIQDYIDARRCPRSLSAQCNTLNSTSTSSYVLLQYINQSARLHGVDLSGDLLLGRLDSLGSFTATGSLSYLKGINATTGDNLYHIMPFTTKAALIHRLGGWTNTVEIQQVSNKSQISHVRNEVKTPGYTLVNLRSSYEWKHGRVDLAAENAFDKFYYQPLGGAYLGEGNSMTSNGVPWGMAVPGRARSLNAALTFYF